MKIGRRDGRKDRKRKEKETYKRKGKVIHKALQSLNIHSRELPTKTMKRGGQKKE